jgi:hypothetical protein
VLVELQASKSDEAVANSEMVRKLQDQHRQLEEMLIKARVEIEVKSAENMALEQQVRF